MVLKKINLYISITTLSLLLLSGCGTADQKHEGNAAPESKANTEATVTQTEKSVNSAAAISEDEAKKIALNHAGLAESEVTFSKVKLDKEDGRAVYEVEFYKDKTEYDYDIDAANGNIISYESDTD